MNKLLVSICCLAASVAALAQSPSPSPLAIPGTGALDARIEQWRSEAEHLTDADIIQEGAVSGAVSKTGSDVVVKGKVNGAANVLSGNVYVLGTVDGPVRVVGGNATILGKVLGPVNVIGGDLRVSGQIDGAASVVGGDIVRTETASIHGDSHSVGGSYHKWRHNWSSKWNGRFRLTWIVLSMLLWLLVTSLVAILMPEILEDSARHLVAEPLRVGAIGLLTWFVSLLLVGVSFILCLLLIGFPMLGLLVLGWFAMKCFGLTVTFLWFGRKMGSALNRPQASVLGGVVIGALVLTVVRMIPVLGTIVWIVIDLLGAGIAIVAFMRRKSGTTPPAHHALAQ